MAARTRRWQAAFITALVGTLALGAAAAGWWYARESPPHQGPLVVVAVDGLPADALADGGTWPSLRQLTAEGVTFTRAYTHALEALPAFTTLLTGRLPFEHGVRDDVGFVLRPEVRTLAELLRNRGFATGAAVSSYTLRRDTGLAQGFTFFDGELPVVDGATAIERPAADTSTTVTTWLRSQDSQRFFLFVALPVGGADMAIDRIVRALKDKGLYDPATIVVVGGRGAPPSEAVLDDSSLRVALAVKQPGGALRGRTVSVAVQVADLTPTVLDLVRAPIPGGLHGRSLRPLLDDEDGSVPARPMYAESLAGYYRLGAAPLYALITETRRLVRGVGDSLDVVTPPPGAAANVEFVPDSVPLSAVLDELVATAPPPRPTLPRQDVETTAARAGALLAGIEPPPGVAMVAEPRGARAAHRRAVQFLGEGKMADAIRTLQGLSKSHPSLGAVHYQVGVLLGRSGRWEDAAQAFAAADAAWPSSFGVALASSEAARRAGRLDQARAFADAAIARAETGAPTDRAAAHESAARVALAQKDQMGAATHAAVSAEADPASQVLRYVKGRLLFDEGKFAEAVEALEAPPEGRDAEGPRPIAELHLYRGESLARLDRADDAAEAFRSEIAAFPRDPRAYVSLAALYRESKPTDAEAVLEQLIEAVPTPEGYGMAANAWAEAGDRRRAESIRASARVKFRGDPMLTRYLASGARR